MDEIICLARDQVVPIIEDRAQVPQAVALAEFFMVIWMSSGTKDPRGGPVRSDAGAIALETNPADTSSRAGLARIRLQGRSKWKRTLLVLTCMPVSFGRSGHSTGRPSRR